MLAERDYSYNRYDNYSAQKNGAEVRRAEVSRHVSFTGREKRRTLTLLVLIGCFFLMSVVTTAFTSSLAYGNNAIRSQKEAIVSEIQDLKVEIQGAMNIGMVEELASEKLGMVYPTGEQVVQLSSKVDIENFADVLRKAAFN